MKNLQQVLHTLSRPNQVPQSMPLPGTAQVANSAGGYSFGVDDWTRLQRFLILGSEGGSYYATEQKLTADSANAVLNCIGADGPRVVRTLVEVSRSGRAPKNDPALFVLALCASMGDEATRAQALQVLGEVARTGTHLFHFAAFVDGLRGWGRGLRRAVGNWYSEREAKDLAYQAIKYVQRDGWSHRDLLRLAHPKAPSESHQTLFHWITQGWDGVGEQPHPDVALQQVWAAERIKNESDAAVVARLVRDYRLPREVVPSAMLHERVVWEALLEEMPMMALVRNLATLTRIGIIAPNSDWARRVAEQLGERERLRKARVHPLSILSALRTYASGAGVRGQNTWKPVAKIVDALDGAFYAAFENVEPTGRKYLLGLDVSGSMGVALSGIAGLSARDGAAAMSLITAATEKEHAFMAFQSQFVPLKISPRQRLDDVVKTMDGLPFGATDCALPMIWARENKVEVDVFAVYTDSETWFGKVHPVQALQQYREVMGRAARLIVVGMVSNKFSIADPNDGGMLDVVGFDTSAPLLMREFVLGEV